MGDVVSLREITRDNIRAVLALKVRDDQSAFVPSVGDMIARASVEENVWYRAVCVGDTPVGFVKVWDPNRLEPDLWGLMIDQEHQGRGYASRAVGLVIAELHTRNPDARRLCVGFLKEDGNACSFYERLGFVVEKEMAFDGWTELLACRDL